MASIEFGLMLRATNPGHTIDDLMTFNQHCIAPLSDGFTTLWLEDHLQWGTTDVLQCLTTLSYLAATYPQFHVRMLVLSQAYRNAALFKIASLSCTSHLRENSPDFSTFWLIIPSVPFGYTLFIIAFVSKSFDGKELQQAYDDGTSA
ncbi:MAG: hypothetical protein E6J34_06495 [Chloroflexi bacterium]|nr:MAG: hypothetical protein E6J34_06495 [Chloroflexota bacterium]